MFYGTGTIASVKLPSEPVAEISMGGGGVFILHARDLRAAMRD